LERELEISVVKEPGSGTKELDVCIHEPANEEILESIGRNDWVSFGAPIYD